MRRVEAAGQPPGSVVVEVGDVLVRVADRGEQPVLVVAVDGGVVLRRLRVEHRVRGVHRFELVVFPVRVMGGVVARVVGGNGGVVQRVDDAGCSAPPSK